MLTHLHVSPSSVMLSSNLDPRRPFAHAAASTLRRGRAGLAVLAVLLATTNGFAGTIYWNMQTAAPTSNNLSSVTVGDLSQGNNNGTTPMLSSTSANSSSSYSFLLNGVSTNASTGNNAQAAARVGALSIGTNGSAYFQFSITPTAGSLDITDIGFGSRSTSTGPQAWTLRSDADSYASDLVTPGTLSNGATWAYRLVALTSPLTIPQNTARTFRIYGYDGTGSPGSNTANWRIDDLQIVPEPSAVALLATGLGGLALLVSRRRQPPAA